MQGHGLLKICLYFFLNFFFHLNALSRDRTDFGSLDGNIPTRRDDIRVLFSENLQHVALHADPFAGLVNSLEAARDDILPKCLSKSPSNVDLASFLGSVFLVGDVIGQGVSGEVLRATRTVNGNAVEVALKVFRRDTSEKDVRAEYAVLQRLHKL